MEAGAGAHAAPAAVASGCPMSWDMVSHGHRVAPRAQLTVLLNAGQLAGGLQEVVDSILALKRHLAMVIVLQ